MKIDSIRYFVGIYVSKDTLDLCFLKSDKTSKNFYKIPNNKESINAIFKSYKIDEITVCYEATNNYHINLVKFLTSQKIAYSELNSFKSSLFLRHLTHIKQI